jgi:hypothetical protein
MVPLISLAHEEVPAPDVNPDAEQLIRNEGDSASSEETLNVRSDNFH